MVNYTFLSTMKFYQNRESYTQSDTLLAIT